MKKLSLSIIYSRIVRNAQNGKNEFGGQSQIYGTYITSTWVFVSVVAAGLGIKFVESS